MNKVIDQVLDKIHKDNIKPISRWKFWVRDSGQWFGIGAFTVLIIIAVGLLWYFWADGPWVHGGRFGFQLLFGRVPLLLIIISVVILILGVFDFYSTKRGYKYSRIKVITSLFLFISLAGWTLYYFGLSAVVDKSLGDVPFYQSREEYMKQVWQHPEEGLMAGEIKTINKDGTISLRDFAGKEWRLDVEKTVWRHNLSPEIGSEIKLIGKMEGNMFVVSEVRPWMGPGNCQMMKQGTCGMIESERKK